MYPGDRVALCGELSDLCNLRYMRIYPKGCLLAFLEELIRGFAETKKLRLRLELRGLG